MGASQSNPFLKGSSASSAPSVRESSFYENLEGTANFGRSIGYRPGPFGHRPSPKANRKRNKIGLGNTTLSGLLGGDRSGRHDVEQQEEGGGSYIAGHKEGIGAPVRRDSAGSIGSAGSDEDRFYDARATAPGAWNRKK